jgi:pyruvate/2-oxoglutarate dehydrogenase complex dihydrolipoamide acyltransferase (E2) component
MPEEAKKGPAPKAKPVAAKPAPAKPAATAKPKETPDVKEAIGKYTDKLAKELGEKMKLDTKTGEKMRTTAENFAVDVRDFSLSFLPESTQKHVVNMNREALLTAQSLINNGLSVLERTGKK